MKQQVRVRFTAPSSATIDLDSMRTALVNFLFAKKHHGDFFLRINDLEIKNFSPQNKKIILDSLSQFKISLTHEPLLTSTRTEVYQAALQELIDNQKVYRCFCPADILERKREQQITMGRSPRYDRSCLLLPQEKIKQKVVFGLPFVWRLKINELQILTAHDLDQGTIDFSMAQLSDPALTNNTGSVTHLFAQFVDDWKLDITHFIYSKKYLGNSTILAALYDTFALSVPLFWHLPISGQNIDELSLINDHCTKLIVSK